MIAIRLTMAGVLALGVGTLSAQAPTDSPHAASLVASAIRAAGPEWREAAAFFCATEQQVAAMKILPSATVNDVEGQRAEPMKVFDNLYFIGQKAVTTWAITTPEGIVLIDAGYADRVDDTLVAGMKKVGLDPANIKMALIAHGHDDHFGAAKILHDRYGTRIGMSGTGLGVHSAARGAGECSSCCPRASWCSRKDVPSRLAASRLHPC
jgi:metallo-beta-lactamase class B